MSEDKQILRYRFTKTEYLIPKIFFAVSAVFSVIFAREGLFIPVAIFGLFLIISCFIPISKEVHIILATAFGFPLLIFAAYPWTVAIILFLLMTGIFYLGKEKLGVKSCIAFIVSAALGGVIMSLTSWIFVALGIVTGIVTVSAYCIIIRISRMKKLLKIKIV